MAAQTSRAGFFETEAGEDIRRLLQAMSNDITYNTPDSYSSKSDVYPDNMMPFTDKHINYLRAHPKLDPLQYVANLRLMTRKKLGAARAA